MRVNEEYERTGDALVSFAALCSVVESSLGDIFATVESVRQPVVKMRQKAPPLLKNLLSTEELKEGIGEEAVFIFQAVIGSPRHLNLRNVIWHGFATASEIHSGYYWVLLLLFLDVLEKAFSEGIFSRHALVHNRDTLRDLSLYSPSSHDFGLGPMAFLGTLKRPDSKALEATQENLLLQLTTFLDSSPFVFPGRANSLKMAIDYFTRGEQDPYAYWFSLIYLLPAMEHCLRAIWVRSNALPSALLCADSFRYYTIMDMFMEPRVSDETMSVEALTTTEPNSHPATPAPGHARPSQESHTKSHATSNPKHSNSSSSASSGKPNALVELFGVPIITALNDTFLFPYGPRPRDRIAHGDVDPTTVSRCTVARCLELFFALALRLSSPCPTPNDDSSCASNVDWSEQCTSYFKQFVSCWHPHSLLQKQLRLTSSGVWRSWQQVVFSLPVRSTSSAEVSTHGADVDVDEEVLVRRNGCPDESAALADLESSLLLKLTWLQGDPLSPIQRSFTFDHDLLSKARVSFDWEELPRRLQSVPVFDRGSQFSSFLESARNFAQEAQNTLSVWLERLNTQKEQIEAKKATSRLQMTVYKLLGIVNYATSYFSIIFRIVELGLHDQTLHQQSIRKVTTLIIRLAQLVKTNSWGESLALMSSSTPLLQRILSC